MLKQVRNFHICNQTATHVRKYNPRQSKSGLSFFKLPSTRCSCVFIIFIVYFISGIAETNRHPFDLAEGEAEIVAGFHVEYSGMGFAIFFLSEYINMALISVLTSIMFLGGWESFLYGVTFLENTFLEFLTEPSIFWLLLKTLFFLFVFVWLRASFPRYRYDQLMTLGWKVLIPITIIWILVECVMLTLEVGPWSIV